jgi:hypothetical protein
MMYHWRSSGEIWDISVFSSEVEMLNRPDIFGLAADVKVEVGGSHGDRSNI